MKKIFFLIITVISLFLIKANAKGFGVGKNEAGVRPNVGIKEITQNGGYTIGADDNKIYLTFDCGYENGYTEHILDTLKKTDTKACFFITGHYLDKSSDIVRRMIDEGHIIGNHTNKHKAMPNISNEEIIEDVTSLEKKFYEKFNIAMSKFVRPPKGEYDERSIKLLSDNGYTPIFWSLAYVDWYKDKFNGNHYSYNHVIDRIHNGAIILMHTVGKDNMVDLEDIIIKLKDMGYVFSSLEEL